MPKLPEEELAKLIYNLFKAQGEYVGDYQYYSTMTCLDGDFDLTKIAKGILDTLNTATLDEA